MVLDYVLQTQIEQQKFQNTKGKALLSELLCTYCYRTPSVLDFKSSIT